MDRFPQELIDQICSYLGAEDLRNAYYVSTRFRRAAEELAGGYRGRSIELISKDKQNFINSYSGFRLRYLKDVEFSTSFPDLDANSAYGCRESVDEQHEKDKAFTNQIQDLFATLKLVEDRAGERNCGKYGLTVYSPSQHCADPCLHREHAHWRTHLLEPETLPDLMSVVSLRIDNGHSKAKAKLDYRTLIDLATRCPNLENLECVFGVDEWTPSYEEEAPRSLIWEYDGPRRDTRHGFGKAITPYNLPKSLHRVDLNFFCHSAEAEHIHHWTPMPNLVMPARRDPFSNSIRILSYHLREITLRAQVDEALFWPEDNSTPTWPHLQKILIMFHMVSPSGAWYFEGPRGEGRESAGYEVNESSYPPRESIDPEEDAGEDIRDEYGRSFENTFSYSFRISPNDKVLEPFLASFAKAAAKMPNLCQAILWSPLRWDVEGGDDDKNENEAFDYFVPPEEFYPDYLAWGFAYYRRRSVDPSYRISGEKAHRNIREIWWEVGEWRPNPEIQDLFRQIGLRDDCDELREHWHDLGTRDDFGC